MTIWNRTDWFPGTIRPIHAGWYEVGHSSYVHHRAKHFLTGSRRFWDGLSWRAGRMREQVSIFGTHEAHQWRGITQSDYFAATGVSP